MALEWYVRRRNVYGDHKISNGSRYLLTQEDAERRCRELAETYQDGYTVSFYVDPPEEMDDVYPGYEVPALTPPWPIRG